MGWGPSTNSECGTSISSSSCCEKPKKTMNQTSDPAQLQHHHSIKTTETSPDENDHRSNTTLHHLNSTRNPSRPNQPPGKPRKPKGKQAEEIERQEVAALVGQSNKEWMDIGDRLLTSRGGGVIIVMDGRRRRRRRIRPSGRHRRRWRRLRWREGRGMELGEGEKYESSRAARDATERNREPVLEIEPGVVSLSFL